MRLPEAATVALLALACGCSPSSDEHRFTRFSMGTIVEYTIVAPDEGVALAAVERAHEEMERVSHVLWEEDSLSVVFAFNGAERRLRAPAEAAEFFRRMNDLAAETGGAFDPTVKPLLDLYGFDDAAPEPPDRTMIDAVMGSVGFERVRVDDDFLVKDRPTVSVAVGGIAKGYAVDRAVENLRRSGVGQAIVNAGGDLYCLGSGTRGPWRVGIRDPDDPARISAVLEVKDAAIATSGDYQRYYERGGRRYHHIIDPATGEPAGGVRSATVVAQSAERADALATALFVLGPTEGLALIESIEGAEGLVVDSAKAIRYTPGMASYLRDDRGR